MGNLAPDRWAVFSDWTVAAAPAPAPPKPPDWAAVDLMAAAHRGVLAVYRSEIHESLIRWNRELQSFGGDPTGRDWREFRPLRLAREEDWADWLAFLIGSSKTGLFSRWLFGGEADAPADYASPIAVEREVAYRGYRSDLMVRWQGGSYAHLEVKIGDEHLAKTYATGKAMRAKYGASAQSWRNFILLLSGQLDDWHGIEPIESDEPATSAVTWERVAIALRRGLRGDEDALWNSCAYMFVGAIEQLLIGYVGYGDGPSSFAKVDVKLRMLTEGWNGD